MHRGQTAPRPAGEKWRGKMRSSLGWIAPVALGVLLGLLMLNGTPAAAQQPAATPTPDRLATPVMPSSPTPVDVGRGVYYTDCMPCHGDRGQGLTDEWRAVWVEDHQNCWARGCHGSHAGDEGFPIPRTVPAVMGTGLATFQNVDDLIGYLKHTQPPQRPGDLSDADYRAVAIYLLYENGRWPDRSAPPDAIVIGGMMLVGLLSAIGLGWAIRSHRRRTRAG